MHRMMHITTTSKYQSYWDKQSTPQHTANTHEYFCSYANELKLLLPKPPFCSVLEIGCVNGALFELLVFNNTDYTGVDFSRSMLSIFHERYPRHRLIVARGEEYCDQKKYDLIFSNALVQYFNKS